MITMSLEYKNWLQTVLLLFAISIGLAGEIQVVDQKTGSPLPGVNITVVGTVEGMNTDLIPVSVLT